MRENNYFDYDGNIPSVYSSFDFVVKYLPENDEETIAESEVLEAVLTVGAAPSAPVIEEAEENVIPEYVEENISDTAETVTSEPSEERAEAPALDEELAAAIEAFENMELQEKKAEEKVEKTEPSENTDKPEPEKSESKGISGKEAFIAVAFKAKEIGKAIVKEIRGSKDREVSRLRHFFIIFLLTVLVIIIFTGVVAIFMQSINKENERSGRFSKNAAEVCSAYSLQYGSPNYENLYDSYKVEGYRLTGLCFIRELDFDNDGESELLLTYNKNGQYYNEVWGRKDKNKDFDILYSEAAANHSSKAKDAYSILYHSRNKYYIAKFDKDKLNRFTLMQLKDNKFESKYNGEYDSKTKAYSVDGKDDTNAFERIKYSVLKEEKASVEIDRVNAMIDSFSVGGKEIETHDTAMTLENAYYQVVQDYNKRYGVCKIAEKNGDVYLNGLAVVELIDFNGDGKNELLLIYRKPVKVRDETSNGENVTYEVEKYFCDIYRYSGNRAVLTYTNEGLSNKLNYRSDVYYIIRREKKKAYYCLNSFTNSDYGNHITAVSAEYEFDGSSFNSTFKSSYNTDYGYSDYYIEGKEVDKYRFNKEGYKNPFFDSSEDYDKEHYRIVYVQRRSADSGAIKDIPKQTERTIQKLNQLYSADIKN